MSPLKDRLNSNSRFKEERLNQLKTKRKKKGLYSLQGLVGMTVVGVFLLLIDNCI